MNIYHISFDCMDFPLSAVVIADGEDAAVAMLELAEWETNVSTQKIGVADPGQVAGVVQRGWL